jgi:aminopeptidase N
MKISVRFLLIVNLFAIIFLYPISAQTPRQNFNRTRTFDVEHYIIRTRFDRIAKIVYGDTTIKFKPLTDKFNTLELDSEGLKFTSVKLVNEDKELVSRVTEDKVFINLGKNYSTTDSISVRLIYTSMPKKGVYFVDELKKDGKSVRASQVWTQGEAAETRHWFPSYDFPDDKATTEQFITVNKGETAIANGDLKDVIDNVDGTQTFHFYMPLPHSTYLTSFVVGTYTKIEDKYKQIPFGYYVYPDRTDIVPNAYGKTKEMMRIFEEITKIKYPFNKYDQTIVANFTFGGMENVTATTMADTEIFLANFDFAKGSVEDLVSHELAHSWFGNLVTCKNWSELWLNEGLATFMESAYREKMYGRADYIRKIKDDVAEFMIEDSYKKNPHGLFNTTADPKDDSIFDSITYKKGGAVIHTLRETIGDEAFWKGVNLYLERHKFGNVESTDLQKAFEESSNTDLNWFFSQWVYKAGFPKINVKTVYNVRTKELELTFNQTQKADSLIPESFVLPLEIGIKTQSGTKIEKIELKKREEVFKFQLSQKPLDIILDKDEKIPLKTVKVQSLIVRSK